MSNSNGQLPVILWIQNVCRLLDIMCFISDYYLNKPQEWSYEDE
jgi:hypothetical protein